MKETCPDCECPIEYHNAVNTTTNLELKVTATAHCGKCGTCWRSEGTPFVDLVRQYLQQESHP